ncbi:MAG: LysM peptidoglycan-binding domain-containing protein [Proteobacteria bacterium]|nr:LysM peptidoglycan-binding domain-containing protein [Pseudomonadota bacterium]
MNLIKFIVIFSILLSGCTKMSHYYKPAQNKSPRSAMPGNNNFGLTYTVKPNDTLSIIANQNGVPYLDIAQWNNLAPPYNIFVGQTLTLYPSQQLPNDTSGNEFKFKQSAPLPNEVLVGANATTSELPQNNCEVSVVRIKTFDYNSGLNNFCGFMSACKGASYIIKNHSNQERVIDIVYASNDEERVLHRNLKIEGQGLFTGKVYNVHRIRDAWNVMINDCFSSDNF